jgi:hypothetical protein
LGLGNSTWCAQSDRAILISDSRPQPRAPSPGPRTPVLQRVLHCSIEPPNRSGSVANTSPARHGVKPAK